jgi:cardiolipin synthase
MIWHHLQVSLLLLTAFSLAALAFFHILLYKRDPRSAVLWLGICTLLPFIGPFLYLLLGVNRLRTHALRLSRRGRWNHGTPIDRRRWPKKSNASVNSPFSSMSRLGDSLTGCPLLAGNKVALLENGETAYPAMLEAIESARQSVHLSSYIFDWDATGETFVKSLAKAHARGVQVRVLVDGVGEKYSSKPISEILKGYGVPCATFLPIRWNPIHLHLNLRNHRKLLIVDGRVGFIGGMNIRDSHWTLPKKDSSVVQDMHFRVEGPVALEMEEVFLGDWFFAAGESLPWRHKVPPGSRGHAACRVISDGPNEEVERMQTLLLGVTGWVKKSLRIMTPYFVPDRVLIAALTQAAMRGVEVELILPQTNNLPFVAWASRAYWWEVLQRGVKIYEQPGPFAHSKALVADGVYALVGSSNLDPRSLRLNFECNLEVVDPDFASRLDRRLLAIRARSRRVTLEKVNSEPVVLRLRNACCKLFAPYL